jgi:hypothetical protein
MVEKFLGRCPTDESFKWSEAQIQIYVAQELRKRKVLHAAGMEGANKGKVGGSLAKLTGQAIGEPDLRIYLSGARVIFFELKTSKGKLSNEQKKRIRELQALGFSVNVIYAPSPYDGWKQIESVINES